jgi:glycerate kinase
MNILLAPDSFKGSLSALSIAEYLELGIKKTVPDLVCKKLPLGDGGEGTLSTMIAANAFHGEYWKISDPFYGQRDIQVGLRNNRAYLESASVLGLPWFTQQGIPFDERNSRALGLLIGSGQARNVSEFQIGLGGTGCHDWGLGLAHELGVHFFDSDGHGIRDSWKNPERIYRFEIPDNELRITALSDIDAPLTGKTGAALRYAHQKGAVDLDALERGALHLINLVQRSTGRDLSRLRGAGAAGGIGFGLAAFFGSKIASGIQKVAESLELDKHVSDCDLVVTGEGKLDAQSFDGKVLSGVLEAAGKHGKSVVLVCGQADETIKHQLPQEIIKLFETMSFASSAEESMKAVKPILIDHIGPAIANLRGNLRA